MSEDMSLYRASESLIDAINAFLQSPEMVASHAEGRKRADKERRRLIEDMYAKMRAEAAERIKAREYDLMVTDSGEAYYSQSVQQYAGFCEEFAHETSPRDAFEDFLWHWPKQAEFWGLEEFVEAMAGEGIQFMEEPQC